MFILVKEIKQKSLKERHKFHGGIKKKSKTNENAMQRPACGSASQARWTSYVSDPLRGTRNTKVSETL